jgi:hypothetical protein
LVRENLSERDEDYRIVALADGLRRVGRRQDAEVLVTGLLGEDPLFVPAARLHQDLLRQRGRAGVLWREVEALKKQFPDRPEPLYLEARLVPDFATKRAMIVAGALRFPRSYWLRYAMAWCVLQDREPAQQGRALNLIEGLITFDVPTPQALILGWIAQRRTNPHPLRHRVRAWAKRFPSDGRLALMLYLSGSQELEHLLSAVENAPASPEIHELLALETLPHAHGRALVRFLARRPELAQRLIDAEAGHLLGRQALAVGEGGLAEAWLSKSIAGTEPSPAVESHGRQRSALRERMSQHVQRGEVEDAIALWQSRVPAWLLEGGDNRLSARFGALLHGPGRGLRGVPATVERCRRVLEVMLRVGWVEEAHQAGRAWLHAFPGDAALTGLVEEAAAFLRFEQGLLDILGAPATGSPEPVTLEARLRRLRRLSVLCLGRDVVGQPRLISFPVVGGVLIDPFGPGLAAWFDHYNRFLVLGALQGGKAVALLGQKIVEARLTPSDDLPLLGQCREVVIEDKYFSNADAVGISDPAGIALWNHYVLDLRSMRRWTSDLVEIRDLLTAEGTQAVLDDPFPRVAPLDFTRPSQVNWKLTARAAMQDGWNDERIWREVYRLLQLHERAHLVDAHRFLPVIHNLGRALWLFGAADLSAESLQSNLEARAECAALAYGADPFLTLAHLSAFVADPSGAQEGVHHIGFRRLLERIVELWHRDGAPGAVDPEANLVAQLHRMPRDKIVQYARQLVREYGF